MEEEELVWLGLSSFERLKQAIELGDKRLALVILNRGQEDRAKIRDRFINWTDMLLTRLASKSDEDEIFRFMKDFHATYLRPYINQHFYKLSPEELMRERAKTWTDNQVVPVKIEEDNEKFTLRIPCPIVGRLKTKVDAGRTKKSQRSSHGEVGFLYCCTQCITSFEIMAIEEIGYPLWVSNPVEEPEQSCIQYIYKDPKFVPEAVYERVGKKKPMRSS